MGPAHQNLKNKNYSYHPANSVSGLKNCLLDKKVSYHKQIARQHSCHKKKFHQGRGCGRPCKIFPSFDHHAKIGVYHNVREQLGATHILETPAPAPL